MPLEEDISKSLMTVPLLAPFADTATAVIVGAATGIITTTISVYMVDKADVLGVNRSRMLAGMNSDLDASLLLQREVESSLLEQFQAL